MKVRAKTFRNDFRIEATADEVDVTTKPSFGENNTKFSNLSSEEWAALKNLSKRNDIVVKSADKGVCLAVRPLPKRSFAATFGYLVLCQNP